MDNGGNRRDVSEPFINSTVDMEWTIVGELNLVVTPHAGRIAGKEVPFVRFFPRNGVRGRLEMGWWWFLRQVRHRDDDVRVPSEPEC